MLRWIAILLGTCVVSAMVGLGRVVPLDGTARGWLLTLTAVSALLLISSFDAYETEAPPRQDED